MSKTNSATWSNPVDTIGDVVTTAIETKGNRRRWSTRNTVGGLIVATACEQIVLHGLTWQAVALCLVGIIPITISFFER